MFLLNFCRLCAKEKTNMIDISSVSDDIVLIIRKLIFKEVINNDLLPRNICYDCKENLLNFNEFFLKCQSAIELLKDIAAHKHSSSKSLQINFVTTEFQGQDLGDTKEYKDHGSDDSLDQDNYYFEYNEECGYKPKLKYEKNDSNCLVLKQETLIHSVYEKEKQNPTNLLNRNKYGFGLFICHICGKKLCSKSALKVHEMNHLPYSERFAWTCEFCLKRFSSKGTLGTHIRVIHEKLRQFVCDICGLTFATRGSLYEHHLTHSKQRNFECDKCSKKFKTKWAVKRHIDTHDDTIYQCPKCQMMLNSRRTMQSHLLVHDPVATLQCPHCVRKFKRRKNLKSHLLIHTGEKPYQCHWCPRNFSNSSNCRMHEKRMHSDNYYKDIPKTLLKKEKQVRS